MSKIYRVVLKDKNKHTTPMTEWHTSKKYCDDYINNAHYNIFLEIENGELIED